MKWPIVPAEAAHAAKSNAMAEPAEHRVGKRGLVRSGSCSPAPSATLGSEAVPRLQRRALRAAGFELRIFLTAAAIVDDIGAITAVAIFYSGAGSMLGGNCTSSVICRHALKPRRAAAVHAGKCRRGRTTAGVIHGRELLMLAIAAGPVVGKPLGIVSACALAVRVFVAIKAGVYSWPQLTGARALGGIGFTVSLFIAGPPERK